MSFQSLGLSPHVVQALKLNEIFTPFPIQEQAIPAILKGKDVLGIAPTGSGKTAAFIAPILEQRQNRNYKPSRDIPVLVLVPTRELAIQIQEFVSKSLVTLRRNIESMAVFGGVSINPQMKYMNGNEILIATPGRLIDLLEKKTLSLDKLETLIIDEADKIFQMGFEKELKQILSQLPTQYQKIIFSATLNDKVTEITKILGIQPTTIDITKDKENIPVEIEQIAYAVTPEDKGPFLRRLIKEKGMEQVLVFVSSTRTGDNLLIKLKKNGIKAAVIHSNKSQGARIQALEDFKNGIITVLITTDLLSRGIHIDQLPVVINYELPRSPLDYIHRIGRTGRANEKGLAISLITPEDEHHFKIIQKKSKVNIELLPSN